MTDRSLRCQGRVELREDGFTRITCLLPECGYVCEGSDKKLLCEQWNKHIDDRRRSSD